MATIKGLRSLNQIIFNELKNFGIDKTYFNDCYEYRYDENSVGWTLFETEIDKYYNVFIKERFNLELTEEDIFLISLLHEVGHYKTDDGITDNVYDFCLEEKERLSEELGEVEDEEEIKKLHWQYFNLPDEWAATYWAVDYIKKHPKKCKNIAKRLQNALNDFYDKNID
jgi:hypothetical protein